MNSGKNIIAVVVFALVMLAATSVFANETIGSLLRRNEQISAEISNASQRGNFQYSNQLISEGLSVLKRLQALRIQHMINDLDDSDTGDILTLRKLKRRLAETTTAAELVNVYSQVERLRTNTLRATCFSRNPFDNSAKLELQAIDNYSNLVTQRANELPAGERDVFFTVVVGSLASRIGASQVSSQPAGTITASPQVNRQKSYCARHNCHYELTEGCHFCRAPQFGVDANIRGNWRER